MSRCYHWRPYYGTEREVRERKRELVRAQGGFAHDDYVWLPAKVGGGWWETVRKKGRNVEHARLFSLLYLFCLKKK